MKIIQNLQKKYTHRLDHLDLELLLAFSLGKNREFVLAHPEKILTARQAEKFENLAKRRLKHEPLAHLTGKKEFYGLDFAVTPATLIPRPETEMLVDEALNLLRSMLRSKIVVIDVGTGSGNIIISTAKNSIWTSDVQIQKGHRMSFFGVDISNNALRVARRNAKINDVGKKIKFIESDLLEYFINHKSKIVNQKLIIIANLPYLSQEIYSATTPNVKKFEPKSALFSKNRGLDHYERLFKQISLLVTADPLLITVLIEFSPEQKSLLEKLIKKYFPTSETQFKKDLAGRTRIAIISF